MSKGRDVEASIREDVGDSVEIHNTMNPEEAYYTSRAKLELALINYKDVIRARYVWVNSFVLFITALSVTIVADFQGTLGISSEIWRLLFGIIAVVALIFSITEGVKWYQNRDEASQDAVIEKLRRTDE